MPCHGLNFIRMAEAGRYVADVLLTLSIKIKGCKLWNNLPAEIKMIQSSSSFKYKLKNYFLQCLD